MKPVLKVINSYKLEYWLKYSINLLLFILCVYYLRLIETIIFAIFLSSVNLSKLKHYVLSWSILLLFYTLTFLDASLRSIIIEFHHLLFVSVLTFLILIIFGFCFYLMRFSIDFYYNKKGLWKSENSNLFFRCYGLGMGEIIVADNDDFCNKLKLDASKKIYYSLINYKRKHEILLTQKQIPFPLNINTTEISNNSIRLMIKPINKFTFELVVPNMFKDKFQLKIWASIKNDLMNFIKPPNTKVNNV